MATDVVAAAPDSVHVAIGPDADGWRALAIVDRALMAGWLARLAGAGIDPERMLPAPLLIAAPAEGVATLRDGGLVLARGARLAFAAEPDLAALLIGETPATEIDAAAFEAGLAAALEAAPVDLRQGDYALKRPWQWDRRRLRRLALLAAAILAVTLIADVARWLRHDFAADAAAEAARATAQEVLPRGTVVTDPEAQVAGRLAETGGGAWQALAAHLVAAVQAGDGVELTAIGYANGALQATAAAPSPAALAALADRLRAAGLNVAAGAPRADGGRQLADFTVTAA
ncbi:MAG: general secretion pathway protein GspL, partial [Alphaproteobacteria bacterium]|nr:general secretion pathway protein GspL [Alphaproteobacteria bacterium]